MEEKKEKKVREPRKKICPICGREYEGYGNDPHPIKTAGRVCDECNAYVVIPTRLTMCQYLNKINK
ncbi:MAG: hypothetical protein J1E16_06560 [Muribaculaceae bacterium]|nr:hypothetical protein [Muribaculaceae bacterium]